MKYPLFDLEIVLINNDLSCFGIAVWNLGKNGWNLIFLVNFRLCMLYYNNIWTSVHVFVKHLMLFICSSSLNILILAAFHVFLLWSIHPFLQWAKIAHSVCLFVILFLFYYFFCFYDQLLFSYVCLGFFCSLLAYILFLAVFASHCPITDQFYGLVCCSLFFYNAKLTFIEVEQPLSDFKYWILTSL